MFFTRKHKKNSYFKQFHEQFTANVQKNNVIFVKKYFLDPTWILVKKPLQLNFSRLNFRVRNFIMERFWV